MWSQMTRWDKPQDTKEHFDWNCSRKENVFMTANKIIMHLQLKKSFKNRNCDHTIAKCMTVL